MGHVESFELRRKGRVVARIQGASAGQSQVVEAGQFHRDPEGLFTVGVAYGTDALPGCEGDRVHYMALGGRHQPGTVDCEPGMAHYSGTPQGRGPREIGPHGCTLVQIDETGHVKNQFIATDTVRWREETVEITASTRSEELEKRLESVWVSHVFAWFLTVFSYFCMVFHRFKHVEKQFQPVSKCFEAF